jgi:hypothetical protein
MLLCKTIEDEANCRGRAAPSAAMSYIVVRRPPRSCTLPCPPQEECNLSPFGATARSCRVNAR